MTSFQKIIKYLAIALAVFIIFNIVSAIFYGISTLKNIFRLDSDNHITENLNSLDLEETSIAVLDIDIDISKLIIQTGNSLKAETNNKYIKSKQENNKLYIEEKNHNLSLKNNNSELIITIPENTELDYVNIETGAGEVEIEEINTKKLDLDLGAGKVTINNLNITKEANIDGGAGEFNILSGSINNLDLDIGVGKFTLSTSLTGNNYIDAGVGAVDIELIGTLEDYTIKSNKGIGQIKIAGENINDNNIIGTGANILEIEGGIGQISINLKNSSNNFITD